MGVGNWEKVRDDAWKLYVAGYTIENIAAAMGLELRKVRAWEGTYGWAETLALQRAEKAAAARAERASSDASFRALSDAIRTLAVKVAKGKASLTAKDVLDLAKATDLAQRVRDRTHR